MFRGLVKNYKLWVLDFNFCQEIATLLMISIPFLMKIDGIMKISQKIVGVSIHTFNCGCIASTTPILTRALMLQRDDHRADER